MKTDIPSLSTGLVMFLAMGVAHSQTAPTPKSGEQTYQAVCSACHASGVAQAPKFADAKAWAPLIAEGQHVLTGHAWVGVRAMPARGGNAQISLAEFSRAVAHMVRNSGGDWKDPDPQMLKRIAHEADKRLSKSIKEQQAMQRELHQFAKGRQ